MQWPLNRCTNCHVPIAIYQLDTPKNPIAHPVHFSRRNGDRSVLSAIPDLRIFAAVSPLFGGYWRDC
jgi:hypothetical protein